jgi:anti-sigma B factor antagonist
MELTEAKNDGIDVVVIVGDIDLESSPRLRDLLRPKVTGKCPKLLLDFTAVNYIDSSGLATLIEYFQSSQTYGGKLALAGLSARVRNVFEIVRLQEIFSLHADVPAAVAALKT